MGNVNSFISFSVKRLIFTPYNLRFPPDVDRNKIADSYKTLQQEKQNKKKNHVSKLLNLSALLLYRKAREKRCSRGLQKK